MDFQNSSQNRKAVKIERNTRSHTKFSIKIRPTLFSREQKWKNIGIRAKKMLKNDLRRLEWESERAREPLPHTKSLPHALFQDFRKWKKIRKKSKTSWKLFFFPKLESEPKSKKWAREPVRHKIQEKPSAYRNYKTFVFLKILH